MGQCIHNICGRSNKIQEDVQGHSDSSEGDADFVVVPAKSSFLNIRFDRTFFCDDIIYQFKVNCSVDDDSDPKWWTTQLTVEELSKFYFENLDGAKLPDQYGKIMRPETFTECLQRVVDAINLSISGDGDINEKFADLLSIPDKVRLNIMYDV